MKFDPTKVIDELLSERHLDDIAAFWYSSFDAEQKDFLKGYKQGVKEALEKASIQFQSRENQKETQQ